ncbi:MAG: PQQ-dependent sugar dehydrogenase [Flavobacteriaceae bacterium]|nr:PQQ-dependent sugar dehydrogenase [Flavobacteriaceae bacterium]MDG1962116.1 PQQ-dependent sugar dehydrogenase [Flavobacteriaceae bacterium]
MKPSLFFKVLLLVFVMSLWACQHPNAQDDIPLKIPNDRPYTIETVVSDLQNPWGMDWLPDQSLLITEKDGRLIHFKGERKIEIKNTPEIFNWGQGGLLDIAVHPNYAENGWIYFTLSTSGENAEMGNTALVRAKLLDDALVSIETLYKASPDYLEGQHFGSRIAFDQKGHVFFSVGDRFHRDELPQDLSKDGGKIYRLNDDGTIPKDNPFAEQENTRRAIYSYGHRNPQGLARHPETGEIWSHEHGPKGGDEINLIKSGANYGWPIITYGINYSGTPITDKTTQEGMSQPQYYWVPSIAPCGMTFVTGDRYPNWKNQLLVGSLKFAYVELLRLEGNTIIGREKIAENIGRVRNVKTGPDGLVYIALEGEGIVKLLPNSN